MHTNNIPLLEKRSAGEMSNSYDWVRSPSISSSGLSVAWKNVTVVAKQIQPRFFKKSRCTYKDIIRNVSGVVQSGTLVAILGASGSGKSTLMSVLANRNPGELEMSGKITIGGTPIGKFTRYVSGFVYQEDLFVTTLTVSEHLNFAAKLRLSSDMTEKSRKILINEILTQLGLQKVAHSRIGSSSFGNAKMSLSGGERKRLSIATELITDPSLLFCDEPTTGLDAFTALKVVSNLRSLVDEREKTIICSIHQPSEQIFELFDQVILLSHGRIAFSGSPSDAVTFFESQGFRYNEEQDRAVYLIESLAKESAASTTDILCSAYEKSEYYSRRIEFVQKEMDKDFSSSQMIAIHKQSNRLSWFSRLCCVSHRNYLAIARDGGAARLRLIQKMLLGLLIGLCMENTITWTQTGLTALKGAVFFLIGQNFFPPIHVGANHLPKNLPIFFREYASDTTTPLLFYLSNVIAPLPGFIIDPFLFTILIYFMANLQKTAFAIIFTSCVVILVLNTSVAFGMCVSVAFKRFDVAEPVITLVVTFCTICSGVFIKLTSIPGILSWIHNVSWFSNGVEALFIVQLYGVDYIECSPNPDIPCLSNNHEVLQSYGFKEDNCWPNILKIILVYFAFHIATYVGILLKLRSRKLK